MSDFDPSETPSGEVISSGPWPFITHRRYRTLGQPDKIWRSRNHRKKLTGHGDFRRLGLKWLLAWPSRPAQRLNWWIGILFAIGSLLFMAGSVLALFPGVAARFGIDGAVTNAVFFAGSIPFSGAAYLQLHQAGRAAAPASGQKVRGGVLVGWKPMDIGWLGCALQFGGTLLFNFNTYDAMRVGLTRVQYDLTVWTPDFIGSALFLASGYLAFIENGHAHWTWLPGNISWQVTFANLLGCGAFMVSAILAFEPVHPRKPGSLPSEQSGRRRARHAARKTDSPVF